MQRHTGPLNLASKGEASIHFLSKVMAIISSIVLAFMMLLTVADVIGRYFFNFPINGAWELIGLLLVCAGTWGLAYCQVEKAHISVTVLLDLFPPGIQAVIRSFAYLTGLTGFGLICWRAILLTQKYTSGEGYVTDTLQIPYYPFTIMMAIGAGMLALILLIDLIHTLREVGRK